jgi:hypothetical protein
MANGVVSICLVRLARGYLPCGRRARLRVWLAGHWQPVCRMHRNLAGLPARDDL